MNNLQSNPYQLALIIDDEPDICYLLSSLLREKKLATRSVFDLSQAKEVIEEINPSVIFIDNHLTDGLGLDFIPILKQKFPDSKVIMITAYDDPESKQTAFTRGADEFISKPLRRDVINATIDKLLSTSAATV